MSIYSGHAVAYGVRRAETYGGEEPAVVFRCRCVVETSGRGEDAVSVQIQSQHSEKQRSFELEFR